MTTENLKENNPELSNDEAIETSNAENSVSQETPITKVEENLEDKLIPQSKLEEIVQQRLARQERKYRRELENLKNSISNVSVNSQSKIPENIPDIQTDPEAYLDYLAEKKAETVYMKYQEKQYQQIQEAQEALRKQDFERKLEKFSSQTSDFEDVIEEVNQTVGFSPEIVYQVSTLPEKNGEVLYFLGKNPTELQRIKALPPHQQSSEIIRLAMQLNTVKNKVSQATPPLSPTKPTGASVTRDPNSYESIKEAKLQEYKRLYGG